MSNPLAFWEQQHPAESQITRLTVFGRPQPQGSSRVFFVKKLGRSVITSANKNLKPWRQQISETAMTLRAPVVDGPIAMGLRFYFQRPKSAPKSRIYPTVKPDTDKLIRAILDSLTGILYRDDAQVVCFDHVQKLYDDCERVEIEVRTL
jgi:Holliday junction resolvase RusA-like endonuclease